MMGLLRWNATLSKGIGKVKSEIIFLKMSRHYGEVS